MNKVNNTRRIKTYQKIEKAFIELIQTKEINEVNVTDIVKIAKINRSTFYVNYLDIYDLADRIREKFISELLSLYKEETITKKHSYDYLKLFRHIKDNQIYYKTLFKLGFDFSKYEHLESNEEEALKYYDSLKNLDYHIEFYKAGLNAIIKKWLNGGCQETPEEINEVLVTEYKGKSLEY